MIKDRDLSGKELIQLINFVGWDGKSFLSSTVSRRGRSDASQESAVSRPSAITLSSRDSRNSRSFRRAEQSLSSVSIFRARSAARMKDCVFGRMTKFDIAWTIESHASSGFIQWYNYAAFIVGSARIVECHYAWKMVTAKAQMISKLQTPFGRASVVCLFWYGVSFNSLSNCMFKLIAPIGQFGNIKQWEIAIIRSGDGKIRVSWPIQVLV
jgi:hypothetical protein